VLSNRHPPFGLTGGVFDALSDSGGSMGAVTNRQAREAGTLFESLEGCDLDPAAEVALAGLIKAVGQGAIDPKRRLLLNLTGGGRKRLAMDRVLAPVQPDCTVGVEAIDRPEAVLEALGSPAVAVR
jgi:cysteate synthase